MQEIGDMLQSPAWWFQAVLVVVIANVVSHAITQVKFTVQWIDYALRAHAIVIVLTCIASMVWTTMPIRMSISTNVFYANFTFFPYLQAAA
jgi:hypothetical protein